MPPATADELARELYQVPPEEFVRARDQRVKELRAQGAASEAAALAKLRRPSVAAWLVNLIVADDPDLPEQLADLAEQLRAAEDQLAGEQLRTLGRQRHQLVAGLVARAGELGRAAGRKASGDALREVEATLRAALSDPDVALRVLSGRLTQTVALEGSGGFGGHAPGAAREKRPARMTPPAGAAATTSPTVQTTRSGARQRADERRRAAELRKAELELEKAEVALTEAEEEVARRADEADKATEHVAAAEQRVSWLRTQLSQAQSDLAAAEDVAARARKLLDDAHDGVEQAQARVDGARARADLL